MEAHAKGFRVHLETPRLDDAGEIAKNANDPEIRKNIRARIPDPYEIEDAMMFIEFSTDEYARGTGYHFCVHLSEEDKVVGAIAISSIDRESSQAELGFWIGKDYRGKGYAKEAIKLAASLAFSKFLLNRIYVYVLVSNEVSIHLLGSLGFVKEGLLRENTQRDGKFYDTLIFSLLKRDYKSLEKEARITINE